MDHFLTDRSEESHILGESASPGLAFHSGDRIDAPGTTAPRTIAPGTTAQ